MAEGRAGDGVSWGLMALLVATWGSSFLFVAFALRDFDPFFLTAARILLAAVAVGATARALAGPFPMEWRFWAWCAPIGVVSLVLPFALYSWAQVEAPSGVVAIYIAATPLIVLGLSHVLGDERMTARGAAGFALGFAGVALLMGWENLSALGRGAPAREAAALGAAAAFAVGAILVKRAPRYHALHATAGALTVGSVVAAPWLILNAPAGAPGLGALAALTMLGLVQTGAGQVTRYLLVKRAGAVFASQTSYLLPIWALFLGWLILDETLTFADAAGFAAILSGVAVASAKRPRGSARL